MHDITTCKGELPDRACPLRDKCFRYTCGFMTDQFVWIMEAPYDEELEKCDEYIELAYNKKKKVKNDKSTD